MFVFLGLGYFTQDDFFPSAIHFPTDFMMSLFFISESYSIVQIHIFFTHSWVAGHLGCFQVLTIMNNASMNIVEQISYRYECAYFGYMPKSGIAGS